MKKVMMVIGLIGVVGCSGDPHVKLDDIDTADGSVDPVCISLADFEQLKKDYAALEQQLNECENTPDNKFYCSIGSKHGKCPSKCYVKETFTE